MVKVFIEKHFIHKSENGGRISIKKCPINTYKYVSKQSTLLEPYFNKYIHGVLYIVKRKNSCCLLSQQLARLKSELLNKIGFQNQSIKVGYDKWQMFHSTFHIFVPVSVTRKITKSQERDKKNTLRKCRENNKEKQ